MKTVLEQLLDKLKTVNSELDLENESQYSYSCALNFCMGEILQLMELEKKQFENSYYVGKVGDSLFKPFENYLNPNFK